jgi:hypothetical protein
MCKAFNELNRIKNKHAFNITGNYHKKKVNQYLVKYFFNDGSILFIYPKKGEGVSVCYNPSINQTDYTTKKLLINK